MLESINKHLGMLQFLQREYIPYIVVATKCDKLGKNELERSLNTLGIYIFLINQFCLC